MRWPSWVEHGVVLCKNTGIIIQTPVCSSKPSAQERKATEQEAALRSASITERIRKKQSMQSIEAKQAQRRISEAAAKAGLKRAVDLPDINSVHSLRRPK